MSRFGVRCALVIPLLLGSCNVTLTWFNAPLAAAPGSVVTLVIAGNISGMSGEAGCVLQLPNGWPVQSVVNNQGWLITRDSPQLLAAYVAEPGHYLVGFSGSLAGGPHGSPIYEITLAVNIIVPASAQGVYPLKLSLAGSATVGAWQIMEPLGVSQFAAITTLPHARTITVGAPPPATFADDSVGLPTAAPALSWTGAAFGDVDGDGRDDFAAVNGYATGTRVWLSRPGTTWVERSNGLPTSALGANVVFAHLDGDGLLDLVDGHGRVCFGDGGTSWLQAAPLPLPLAPTQYQSVAVGDVDGDGLADLVITASNQGALEMLLNNGNRTFRNVATGLPAASTVSGSGVVLADMDGDGNLDLVWSRGSTLDLWLGNGQANWVSAGPIPLELLGAVGDLDADGILEMVGGTGFTTVNGGGLSVCRRTPAGVWAPIVVPGLPPVGRYSSIVLLDFDRDGRLDLVTGQRYGLGGLEMWRNTGAEFSLEPHSGLPPSIDGGVGPLATGDFDGNSFPDLMSTTLPGSTLSSPGMHMWQNRRTGAVSFGTGCAGGPVAEPRLLTIGAPHRGNTSFAAQVHTQAPGLNALFWLGGTRVSSAPVMLPFDVTPLGAPGCTVWTSIDFPVTGPVDAAGNFTVALPVPNDPTLAYATLFAQGGVFAPSANPFGMVFTSALALRIE